MNFDTDALVLLPDDIDLTRSPLAGHLDVETYVLGVFNPGLTRLASGNLMMIARVAEALRQPIMNGHVHSIRWEASEEEAGRYLLDAWPLEHADTADPRTFMLRGGGWKVMALTSISWLLPVELAPDGLTIVAMHYDRVIAPRASWQCYGVEDPRISKVDDRYLMTTCSVSPERQSTTLYSSADGLKWTFEDILLDHQNKDMLIFEGLIDGKYWAQTRPLGDLYFAYPHEPAWAMAIDLDLCIGCNACATACVAENNVPMVGKEQVAKGREMHWLRIDRYYEGPPETPEHRFQPVPCMHCEDAPCEMGCPVNATLHSPDGLNLQVYNRCIGTRTCSAYCPYKVRRFNWLDYTRKAPEELKAQRNPEVTVRDRGVMEKCTYCIQRVTQARIAADKENRPLRDGEVLTACQQACPTQAIVFGDLSQKESAVSRRKADGRDYALLEEANTRPRTTYGARIRSGKGKT